MFGNGKVEKTQGTDKLYRLSGKGYVARDAILSAFAITDLPASSATVHGMKDGKFMAPESTATFYFETDNERVADAMFVLANNPTTLIYPGWNEYRPSDYKHCPKNLGDLRQKYSGENL